MPERMRFSARLLPVVALGLAMLLLWLWFGWQPRAPTHRLLDAGSDSPPGGDFVLQSATGPVGLADFRGKLVLLYFGYTACPDVCPTNLALTAMALRELTPEERARVQALFVSVDPQRDDPGHLKQYVEYFHPDIIGLTDKDARLRALAGRYGAVYRRSQDSGSAMGYLIDHSASTYLIDSAGRLRETLGHATPSAELVAILRRYLADTGAQSTLPAPDTLENTHVENH
ncbi:SCO1/SenC [Thiorhodovibrio winogradskyi]|uniref:SCO1/SenC n=1 Tax=Thiorhodovibrio winogradskyi TaxID=77007 RepID=A0ABZ0SGQ0_9GAMM|nr:SCO family protein [Thiorhodovibrio winogradskyi]